MIAQSGVGGVVEVGVTRFDVAVKHFEEAGGSVGPDVVANAKGRRVQVVAHGEQGDVIVGDVEQATVACWNGQGRAKDEIIKPDAILSLPGK